MQGQGRVTLDPLAPLSPGEGLTYDLSCQGSLTP